MTEKKFDDVLLWDRTTIILVERIPIDLHVNQVFILDYKEVSTDFISAIEIIDNNLSIFRQE